MSKRFEEYIQRMGNMPCYKFPEKLDEDEEFEYFKFKVPRQYIKEHIAMGEVWPHDVDTDIVGVRDESIVLGVIFLPVYFGVEYLEEDDDFLYYKVRVPKVFLDFPIRGSELTYRTAYETKTLNLEMAEQKAERESEDIECEKIPKAGESMVGKKELMAVRKAKESKPLLYEVVFRCNCGLEVIEVGSDLFEMLYARSCSVCGCSKLKLVGCKSLVNGGEDAI